jgi:protein-tyrosine-phosphatase
MAADVFTPPAVLGLAGHPLRWRLLSELARGDRRVRELTAALDRPQSLVSYHLGRLRSGGLVTARRSSADGRDAYYSVDLAGYGAALATAGQALHPGVALAEVERPPTARTRMLFLCTGNSARSRIAEALAIELGAGRVTARSAGSHPKPLHPEALRVMRERGIELPTRPSQSIATVGRQRFDHVISLCDKVREVCPEFPGAPTVTHWSIADPSRETDPRAAFRACAAELETRIRFLLRTR